MNAETTDKTPRTGHTLTLIAGVAVVVCLLASATALVIAGKDPATVVALLTGVASVAAPLLLAVGKLVDVKSETETQTETLSKIDHQTNGVLTARIREAVAEALNEPIAYVPTESDEPEGGKAA